METNLPSSHLSAEDNKIPSFSRFHVLLTYDMITPEAASNAVGSDAAGAISLFIGTTRDNFDGKKVTRLEYEAYEPMAKKEMFRLCQQAISKWTSIISIAMFHRLGVVPVGESSVIIAVSSPHRKDAIGKLSNFCSLLASEFNFVSLNKLHLT